MAFSGPHTPFHAPPANLHGYGANPGTNLLNTYTTAAALPRLGHAISARGFSLTVPENVAASQTMWHSTDLDFWSPVSGVTCENSGGNLTFTAPTPLPEKDCSSVLTESQ